MKQKILTLLFSILLSCGLHAQKENSRWYFGHNTGMDFMNLTTRTVTMQDGSTASLGGVPSPLVGPISTWEGSFTLCDKDGNFLFASDGMTVYNGVNPTDIMKNGTGLYGNPSSAQSGVIVPHPGKKDHYFIITTDAQDRGAPRPNGSEVFGICYSEVDLSVRGNGFGTGRGEVIQKNVPMTIGSLDRRYAYEGVAAFAKSDGSGFWVVNRTRGWFFVWEVTKDGIDPISKYYAIGTDPGITGIQGNTIQSNVGLGHTKFSPDGKYIANSAWGVGGSLAGSYLTIADFDTATGIVSNPATRFLRVNNGLSGASAQSYGYIYGIEFSPNAEYLYFTCFQRTNYTSDIWKVRKANYSTLTWERVWANHPRRLVNIGLGPDNRMYGICGNSSPATTWPYLVVFLNPNEGATEYAFIDNYFTYPNVPAWGLPNFVYSHSNMSDIELTPPTPCLNKPVNMSIQISAGTGPDAVTSIEWDFGDGTSIVTETDMNQLVFTQTHAYTQRDTYTLTITPKKSDGQVITEKVKTVEVKVSRCILPVNHNISVMGYYD